MFPTKSLSSNFRQNLVCAAKGVARDVFCFGTRCIFFNARSAVDCVVRLSHLTQCREGIVDASSEVRLFCIINEKGV